MSSLCETHSAPYTSILDLRETEQAIKEIKDFFERALAAALKLRRVTAPLFVAAGSGINDDLNGVEPPVSFRVPALDNQVAEVVQSLAKWKRLTLAELGIRVTPAVLREQLARRGAGGRQGLLFHRRLLGGELPASIGGGIGQSRLCTVLLKKTHIGEVQAGMWPPAMREECRRLGIPLL